MANLNLSEFGEKLFVADADHTFIWDTAASISKRVSRNSWLNSGTLTSDAPVTISQTWNNAAVAFTGLKFNAAGTSDANSAADSLLLDLQLNTARRFSVRKNGLVYIAGTIVSPNGLNISSSENGGNQTATFSADGVRIPSQAFLGFTSASSGFGGLDTILLRDSASGNTLGLRNGINPQTFNVYGTYSTSPSLAYSRLAIACDTSGNATLTTQSTGVAGTVSINGVPVGLGKGNVSTNVAIGTGALNANTTGSRNTVIGNDALLSGIVGLANVAIGYSALKLAIGSQTGNTAVGDQALQNCTTSGYNTALGQGAGFSITASATLTSSQNSVFIGALTSAEANSQTNQIVIGYNALGIGSNSVVLGNDSITKTALKGNVGIGTTSPSSKLQVSAGDVEVDTIAKGVILKSPDGTRYRVTVANGGTLSVAAV